MARAIFVRDAEHTERIDWKSTVYAGLVAGAVFMVLEMMMVWLFLGQSMWGPPRMIAAMVLGTGVLPPPATFDIGIVMTAMIVHFMLSVILALILAPIIRNMKPGAAVTAGAVFGLAVYLINFYPIAAMFFPWFSNARNWVSVVAHIVFGAVLAWSYMGFVRHSGGAGEQARRRR